ncbi:hypothetical protein ACFWV1_32960 [Streptomyces sp. NPDC058700]|uniref:hypothetical protein n=1 Tax=unclassified Streptomyces TaxID=2593676 RepID=UPI0036468E34
MSDRELTPDEMHAAALLLQLQALSPKDAATAIRISLRMPDGTYLGDALLSRNAADALTDATLALVVYRDAQPDDGIDDLLIADLEEYCLGLDADGLLAVAATDPASAVAAFDEITGFGKDEEQR